MKITVNRVTSITSVYDEVARTAGVNVDLVGRYDCTKITVAQNIFDKVKGFYKESGSDQTDFAMCWVCYGPKVDDKLEDDEVEIQHGFFIMGEEDE